MGLLDLLNHVLNFAAPALWVAAWVTLAARFLMRKRPPALSLWAQTAINFVVSAAFLGLGLWFFGRDGKMASYSAMALACASSQWLLQRGWRA